MDTCLYIVHSHNEDYEEDIYNELDTLEEAIAFAKEQLDLEPYISQVWLTKNDFGETVDFEDEDVVWDSADSEYSDIVADYELQDDSEMLDLSYTRGEHDDSYWESLNRSKEFTPINKKHASKHDSKNLSLNECGLQDTDEDLEIRIKEIPDEDEFDIDSFNPAADPFDLEWDDPVNKVVSQDAVDSENTEGAAEDTKEETVELSAEDTEKQADERPAEDKSDEEMVGALADGETIPEDEIAEIKAELSEQKKLVEDMGEEIVIDIPELNIHETFYSEEDAHDFLVGIPLDDLDDDIYCKIDELLSKYAGFDEVHCGWCDEVYPISDCRHEADLGWLCPNCISAIKSRGEHLTFEESLTESKEENDIVNAYGNKQSEKIVAKIEEPGKDGWGDPKTDVRVLAKSADVVDNDEVDTKYDKVTKEVSDFADTLVKDQADKNAMKVSKLVEAADQALNVKLKEHDDYIKWLQDEISNTEEKLKSAKNNFVKETLKTQLDAIKAALEAALPEQVKNEAGFELEEPEDLPTPEDVGVDTKNEEPEKKPESK